jgi:hypothetical protein
MSRFFDQVERELVRAARVKAKRRRRSRFVALGLAAARVTGADGSAAGATYLALRNRSIAPFAADSTTAEQRVEPGTSRVLALRVADPAPASRRGRCASRARTPACSAARSGRSAAARSGSSASTPCSASCRRPTPTPAGRT